MCPRRRHDRGEAAEKLTRRHHAMRLILPPWILELIGDSTIWQTREAPQGEGRTGAVAKQDLSGVNVVPRDGHGRVQPEAERLARVAAATFL